MQNSAKELVWKSKESIWKFFQNSGKKHLFITGKKHIGKTTLLAAILEEDIDYGGIITRAIRKGQNMPDHILLEDINDSSINAIIGIKNQQCNAMIPCNKGFEETGLNILNAYLNSKKSWIVIDEIGFLESNSPLFQDAIRTCLQGKKLIAVLRKGNTSFLEELYEWPYALLIDLDSFFPQHLIPPQT